MVVSGIGLVEDIVLRAETISRVKTQDLRSGDDGDVALFPSLRRHFWITWPSGVVLVVVVLLL